MFIYFERERACVSRGGAERKRENPKQATTYHQCRARHRAPSHEPNCDINDLSQNQESDTQPSVPPIIKSF